MSINYLLIFNYNLIFIILLINYYHDSIFFLHFFSDRFMFLWYFIQCIKHEYKKKLKYFESLFRLNFVIYD